MISTQDYLEFLELPQPSKSQPCKHRIPYDHIMQNRQNMGVNFAKRVISIAALKGGIGKTFLTTNVAIRASMMGAMVLILDLDPEACATNSLLPEERINTHHKVTILEIFKNSSLLEDAIIETKYPGLSLLPAALRISKTERVVNGKNPKWLLKKLIQDLDYDYIFFELPPSFSTLSSAAYLASDLILIPCTPNIHALESVDLTIEAVNEVSKEFECDHIKYKVLMNMYNPHRTASQDTYSLLVDDYSNQLLPFQNKRFSGNSKHY